MINSAITIGKWVNLACEANPCATAANPTTKKLWISKLVSLAIFLYVS